MQKSNKGFTLIELVLVIVILGILAAIAIPRFADLRTRAYQSAGDGVTGAIASTIILRHSEYILFATEYDITVIRNLVDVGGGLTLSYVTVGSATSDGGMSGTLMATDRGGNTWRWTYTARLGSIPGKVSAFY